MNIIDPIVLILLFLFALRGYFKGLFRETFSLGGLIVGFMVAVRYDESMAALGANYWKASPLLLRAAAFVALFFAVYFLFSLAGWILHQSEKALFLQTFNRVGGVALGLGKGAAIVALVVYLLVSSSWMPGATRQKLDSSYLVPPLSHLARSMLRIGKSKFFLNEETETREAKSAGTG